MGCCGSVVFTVCHGSVDLFNKSTFSIVVALNFDGYNSYGMVRTVGVYLNTINIVVVDTS
jgi:hypothetical protein